MKEYDMKHISCLIDSHHGVYIPQIFAEMYIDGHLDDWNGIRKEDIVQLLEGPSADWYWDAWTNVLDNAKSDDGHFLDQDGDLWVASMDG